MIFQETNDILRETADRMSFKETTNEDDIILLVFPNNMLWAVVFSISEINMDGNRKVIIKILSIPPLEMNLNINDKQLDGEEPFLIESNQAFMKAVDFSKSWNPREEVESMRDEVVDEKVDEKVADGEIVISGNKTVN